MMILPITIGDPWSKPRGKKLHRDALRLDEASGPDDDAVVVVVVVVVVVDDDANAVVTNVSYVVPGSLDVVLLLLFMFSLMQTPSVLFVLLPMHLSIAVA